MSEPHCSAGFVQRALFSLRMALFAVAACLFFSGCGDGEKGKADAVPAPSPLTAGEVTRIFNRYVTGDYDGYVAEVASCDGKPADYRRQMATLYKQHAADQRKDVGDITAVHVVGVKPQTGGRAALAYVSLSYTGGKTEEILLEFVHDGRRWRLR